MEANEKALDAALAKRAKVDELLFEARAAVDADADKWKGVRGAPTVQRRNRTAALKAAVVRLEAGLLPGEHREIQAAPAGSLAASARASAQHHAEAAPVPSGRPLLDAGDGRQQNGGVVDGSDVSERAGVGNGPSDDACDDC